jgi:hypothetical protein
MKNLRSTDLRQNLGGLLLLRVSQYRCLNAIGQKKVISYSLAFIMKTERRGLCNILTIGAMDKTSAPSKVKLSLLRSISVKIGPLVSGYYLSNKRITQTLLPSIGFIFPTYKIMKSINRFSLLRDF